MSIDLEEKIDYESRYPSYQKTWLTPDDMFLEFGFSKSSQAKMRMVTNSSTIPFSKIGRYIRYKREDINQWLENHQVKGVQYVK